MYMALMVSFCCFYFFFVFLLLLQFVTTSALCGDCSLHFICVESFCYKQLVMPDRETIICRFFFLFFFSFFFLFFFFLRNSLFSEIVNLQMIFA